MWSLWSGSHCRRPDGTGTTSADWALLAGPHGFGARVFGSGPSVRRKGRPEPRLAAATVRNARLRLEKERADEAETGDDRQSDELGDGGIACAGPTTT